MFRRDGESEWLIGKLTNPKPFIKKKQSTMIIVTTILTFVAVLIAVIGTRFVLHTRRLRADQAARRKKASETLVKPGAQSLETYRGRYTVGVSVPEPLPLQLEPIHHLSSEIIEA